MKEGNRLKVLLIGGTGTISLSITQQLAKANHEVYVVNRGHQNGDLPAQVNVLRADYANEEEVALAIAPYQFDVVANFIAFRPEQVQKDVRLFRHKTRQYVFISSASAYQKPLSDYKITESTPLANPFWAYSRDKIACEQALMNFYREEGFPVTIVRPSHTYDERAIPLGVHGKKGSWSVIRRLLEGKPVIIHGDGSSLWTMTHSRDFAKGFIGLLGNRHALGEAVHITSDESLTWNQIYQTLADTLGVSLKASFVPSSILARCSQGELLGPLLGDKANTVVFDNAKIKRLVPDFVATTRYDQGIQESLHYYESHPELQLEDPDFDAWCDQVIALHDQMLDQVQTMSLSF